MTDTIRDRAKPIHPQRNTANVSKDSDKRIPQPILLPFLGHAESLVFIFFGILLNRTGSTSAWSGFSKRWDKRVGPIGGSESTCSNSYSTLSGIPGSEGHCWTLTSSLRKNSNLKGQLGGFETNGLDTHLDEFDRGHSPEPLPSVASTTFRVCVTQCFEEVAIRVNLADIGLMGFCRPPHERGAYQQELVLRILRGGPIARRNVTAIIRLRVHSVLLMIW